MRDETALVFAHEWWTGWLTVAGNHQWLPASRLPRGRKFDAHVAPQTENAVQRRMPRASDVRNEPRVRVRVATADDTIDINLLRDGVLGHTKGPIQAGRIRIPDHAPGTQGERVRISFSGADAGFQVLGNKRSLAGDLVVMGKADGTTVICAEMPLELYLVGVLAKEVSSSWPASALEAQAVAARSYALARWQARQQRPGISTRLKSRHGICRLSFGSTPFHAAVAATRGQVLTHDDRIVLAYFHAASGGRTNHHRMYGQVAHRRPSVAPRSCRLQMTPGHNEQHRKACKHLGLDCGASSYRYQNSPTR